MVFVDTKVCSWGFLINEPDCLKGFSLVGLVASQGPLEWGRVLSLPADPVVRPLSLFAAVVSWRNANNLRVVGAGGFLPVHHR